MDIFIFIFIFGKMLRVINILIRIDMNYRRSRKYQIHFERYVRVRKYFFKNRFSFFPFDNQKGRFLKTLLVK